MNEIGGVIFPTSLTGAMAARSVYCFHSLYPMYFANLRGLLHLHNHQFYIIRAREGEHTFLRDLDKEPDTITISTDMFSSYAIVYAAGGAEGGHIWSSLTIYLLNARINKYFRIILICIKKVRL